MAQDDKRDLSSVYDTIHFIERNYNREISIKELEQVSHYSYRNIQRIFRYTCAETIGAFQKRLRVENAYKMILYTKESLTSIALEVGFATIASFSKAFRQQFGISPKEARAGKLPLFARSAITPVPADRVLKPQLIYNPAITLYCQRAHINYVHEEIEAHWARFMQLEFAAQGNEFYGIIADEPMIREDLHCRYDACCSVQPLNKKLPVVTTQAGRYAQFEHAGAYDSIEDTYRDIYAGWILGTNLEFAPSPVIEKYVKHPDNTTTVADQLTFIWIPLK